ncbi:MAG: hypothetical protein Q8910_02510, partial [Bacteroidota bacterium]|nr:hypothetical protein [Bacteroidota bacterium]
MGIFPFLIFSRNMGVGNLAYVDSSGQKHISLSEASHGYAAQTLASRDAAGVIVGDSTGSRYAREQEAQKEQAQQAGFLSQNFQSQNEYLKQATAAIEKERAPTIQKQGIVSSLASKVGLSSQLETANKYVSNYIPSLETIQEKRDTALEKVGLLDERQRGTQFIQSHEFSAGVQNYYVGGYKTLKETPVSWAAEQGAIVAASVVGGGLIKGVGLGARTVLVKAGLPKIANAVEPATNIVLGAGVVKEALEIKSVEQGMSFGTDLVLMGAGYKAGQKLGVKAWDSLRTYRAQEIPTESLIKPKVISGKEQFPQTQKGASAQDVINSYKDPSGEYVGYHATTTSLGKEPITWDQIKRPDDLPGLYVSPLQEGTSPHFLRLSSEPASNLKYASKGFNELKTGIEERNIKQIKQGSKIIGEAVVGTSTTLEPNVMKISIPEVSRLPSNIRTSFIQKGRNSVPKNAQNWLKSDEATKGTAYLTPLLESKVEKGVRAEAEAVITPGTQLKQISSEKHFFEWEGRKVELKEYKAIESDSFKSPSSSLTEYNVELDSGIFKKAGSNKDLVTADDLLTSYRYEVPERKGLISYVALPSRPSGYTIDPFRSSSYAVDSLRSSSYSVDPLRSSSSTIDPLRSFSYTVDPLRSFSSTIDPFRYVSDSNNRYIPDISHSDPFDYRPPPSPPDGRIIPPLPDGRIIPP